MLKPRGKSCDESQCMGVTQAKEKMGAHSSEARPSSDVHGACNDVSTAMEEGQLGKGTASNGAARR